MFSISRLFPLPSLTFPAPPSLFNTAAAKISSLSTWHKGSAAIGLGCAAKAMFDINKANTSKNPEVQTYLYRAVAGLVSTTALTCIGIFGGSVLSSALGCAAVGYTFYAVYRIGQADPNPILKRLVSRAYFGLTAVALIPAIGAGFGVVEVMSNGIFPLKS